MWLYFFGFIENYPIQLDQLKVSKFIDKRASTILRFTMTCFDTLEIRLLISVIGTQKDKMKLIKKSRNNDSH